MKGCTSHHTRVDFLDNVLKDYIKMVKLNSVCMLKELEKSVASEANAVKENNKVIKLLQNKLENTKEELNATKKRKVKDILKSPDNEELIEETYNEIE